MDKAALLDIAVRLDNLVKILRKEAEKELSWGEAFYVGCQIAATERLLGLIKLRFSLFPKQETDDVVHEYPTESGHERTD